MNSFYSMQLNLISNCQLLKTNVHSPLMLTGLADMQFNIEEADTDLLNLISGAAMTTQDLSLLCEGIIFNNSESHAAGATHVSAGPNKDP